MGQDGKTAQAVLTQTICTETGIFPDFSGKTLHSNDWQC